MACLADMNSSTQRNPCGETLITTKRKKKNCLGHPLWSLPDCAFPFQFNCTVATDKEEIIFNYITAAVARVCCIVSRRCENRRQCCGRRSRILHRQPALRDCLFGRYQIFASDRYHSTRHLPPLHRSHRNYHPTLAGQLVARKRI